ncbi:hypothetical protein AGOR_G00196710 [Albula goreensis]|uniref:Fibrinogen C-terminal domain-containing protein n=1 Tax=Albula goreensis TaxID=1534307 RepID=A0A8T3CRV3_9TELE|nr:hypothetical protein AGOR_G00196710 [Albula goreensis]
MIRNPAALSDRERREPILNQLDIPTVQKHYLEPNMMVSLLLLLLLPVLALSHPVKFLPLDCEDVYKNGSIHSGVYTIFPAGHDSPVEVYCDMDCEEDDSEDKGGWTVIQRRMDGTVNFYRPWDQYKKGFGNPAGEYWLGLHNMFLITWTRKYRLRVDMEDFTGGKVHAHYSSFAVDTETERFKLHIGNYIDGGAGNSLISSNGQRFSTFNHDYDYNYYHNYAQECHGGFWFGYNVQANPNGLYTWGHSSYRTGVLWSTWKGHYYSLKAITMKIRPLSLDDLQGTIGYI